MKKLTTTLFLSFALFTTACGKGGADEYIKLAEEMCSCKDVKCVEDIEAKQLKVVEGMSEPSEDTFKKLLAADEKSSECKRKLKKEAREAEKK
jgi:hypothetical protein